MYIPLGWAQKLSDNVGKVNQIYVKADSANDIAAVKKEIKQLMPKATVTTSEDLASQVSGSLSSASSLADSLGKWLAIAALIASFAVASLLTVSAVSRRVREFGTLKALGWKSRRIVGQVLGESVVQGVIGAVLGVALGIAGARLIAAFSPALKATLGRPRRPAPERASRHGRKRSAAPPQTVTVQPDGPVSLQLDRHRRGAGSGRRSAGRRARRLARLAPASRRRPAPARLTRGGTPS